MKPILVVGSANADLTVQVPRLPRPGETVGGGRFSRAHGGKGANQAVAAARAGASVALVGCVGEDELGADLAEGIAARGVDTRFLYRVPGEPTGVGLIAVDADGENAIATAEGANNGLTPALIDRAAEAFAGAGAVLLQLEVPRAAVAHAVGLAAAAGVPVILNAAPAPPRGRPLADSLLRQVAVLVVNETEAEAILGLAPGGVGEGQEAWAAAAVALREAGPGAVVITLGRRGAFYDDGRSCGRVAGFPVEAVDTTAAGDVFCGALAVELARDRGEGASLAAAVGFANAAAALSVQRLGAQGSAPDRDEVAAFRARFG